MDTKLNDDIIRLNVGGMRYETTLNTITSDPGSMLANMFSGRHLIKQAEDGFYFIDRDGDFFKYIIKYLRDKKLNLTNIDINLIEYIRDEANYFNIVGLVNLCDQKLMNYDLMNYDLMNYDIKIENMLSALNILYDFDIKTFELDFNTLFGIDMLVKYTEDYIIARTFVQHDAQSDWMPTGTPCSKCLLFSINSIIFKSFSPKSEIFYTNVLMKHAKHRNLAQFAFSHNNDKSGLFRSPYFKIWFVGDSLYLCLSV